MNPAKESFRPPLAGVLALAGGLSLGLCQWLIFVYAPEEATLGIIQKIFYFHMPMAWWGLVSFFVTFLASMAFLRKKSLFADALAGVAAEVGLLFCVIALVSGCIWARRSWGVWWTWDPKLNTTLIMCFIYAAYLIIRKIDLPSVSAQRRGSLAAVIGIVAFIDVPLVFFATRLWGSMHPTVIASKGGGMTSEMAYTTIACVLCLGLFWAGLLLYRYNSEKLKLRLDRLAAARAGM